MYIYILGGVYMYVRLYVCYLNPGGDDVEIWNLISRNTYRLLRSRHRHCKITKKSIRKRKEKTKRRKQIELSQKTLTAIRNTLTVMAGMAVCVGGGGVIYEPARCNVYAFLPACLLLLATGQRCGILQLPLAEILGKEAHREGVNAPEHVVGNHTTRCLGQQLAKLGKERGHS